MENENCDICHNDPEKRNYCTNCGNEDSNDFIDCGRKIFKEDLKNHSVVKEDGVYLRGVKDDVKISKRKEPEFVETKIVSEPQTVLAMRLLTSKRILDKEYQDLMNIWQSQVKTSLQASIFIEHVLGLMKFRRMFLNKKHKAYKRCFYCKSRKDVVKRYNLDTGKSFWVCAECIGGPIGIIPVPESKIDNGK